MHVYVRLLVKTKYSTHKRESLVINQSFILLHIYVFSVLMFFNNLLAILLDSEKHDSYIRQRFEATT